ncbi:MAG: TFIIB-type zinc ribbon-containing protein [Thermoplasmataceae archaeon]
MKLPEINASNALFNQNGDLILPSGAVEEFRHEGKAAKKIPLGKTIRCPKCGHEWELLAGTGSVRRCHSCGARVMLEAME